MDVSYHISFRTRSSQELVDYLEMHRIPFDKDDTLSCLDILGSNPHWEFVLQYTQKRNLLRLPEMIFTEDERRNAEWLTIRSKWRNGYPQPESTFITEGTTYSRENMCQGCANGEIQVEPFRIKKAPKWGQRHFMELNWIFDELFVDELAKTTMEEAGVTGISFGPVTDKWAKETFEGVYQLIIPARTQKGLVDTCSIIGKMYTCPCCGTKKYLANGVGMLEFQKECFQNAPDFVKTAEVFGDIHIASREILVRQSVYRLLKEKKLDRGLVFEPVCLV